MHVPLESWQLRVPVAPLGMQLNVPVRQLPHWVSMHGRPMTLTVHACVCVDAVPLPQLPPLHVGVMHVRVC